MFDIAPTTFSESELRSSKLLSSKINALHLESFPAYILLEKKSILEGHLKALRSQQKIIESLCFKQIDLVGNKTDTIKYLGTLPETLLNAKFVGNNNDEDETDSINVPPSKLIIIRSYCTLKDVGIDDINFLARETGLPKSVVKDCVSNFKNGLSKFEQDSSVISKYNIGELKNDAESVTIYNQATEKLKVLRHMILADTPADKEKMADVWINVLNKKITWGIHEQCLDALLTPRSSELIQCIKSKFALLQHLETLIVTSSGANQMNIVRKILMVLEKVNVNNADLRFNNLNQILKSFRQSRDPRIGKLAERILNNWHNISLRDLQNTICNSHGYRELVKQKMAANYSAPSSYSNATLRRFTENRLQPVLDTHTETSLFQRASHSSSNLSAEIGMQQAINTYTEIVTTNKTNILSPSVAGNTTTEIGMQPALKTQIAPIAHYKPSPPQTDAMANSNAIIGEQPNPHNISKSITDTNTTCSALDLPNKRDMEMRSHYQLDYQEKEIPEKSQEVIQGSNTTKSICKTQPEKALNKLVSTASPHYEGDEPLRAKSEDKSFESSALNPWVFKNKKHVLEAYLHQSKQHRESVRALRRKLDEEQILYYKKRMCGEGRDYGPMVSVWACIPLKDADKHCPKPISAKTNWDDTSEYIAQSKRVLLEVEHNLCQHLYGNHLFVQAACTGSNLITLDQNSFKTFRNPSSIPFVPASKQEMHSEAENLISKGLLLIHMLQVSEKFYEKMVDKYALSNPDLFKQI